MDYDPLTTSWTDAFLRKQTKQKNGRETGVDGGGRGVREEEEEW